MSVCAAYRRTRQKSVKSRTFLLLLLLLLLLFLSDQFLLRRGLSNYPIFWQPCFLFNLGTCLASSPLLSFVYTRGALISAFPSFEYSQLCLALPCLLIYKLYSLFFLDLNRIKNPLD